MEFSNKPAVLSGTSDSATGVTGPSGPAAPKEAPKPIRVREEWNSEDNFAINALYTEMLPFCKGMKLLLQISPWEECAYISLQEVGEAQKQVKILLEKTGHQVCGQEMWLVSDTSHSLLDPNKFSTVLALEASAMWGVLQGQLQKRA